MSLLGGDLTTPARVAVWMAAAPTLPSAVVTQLIGSQSAMIRGKLNRGALYSQIITRTFSGLGNSQIVLPDYPLTSVIEVEMGSTSIPAAQVPNRWGYRYVPWDGNLPGEPGAVELVGGSFYTGYQNVRITYRAGYVVLNELATVPLVAPYTVLVQQPLGVWCRDNGVMYAGGNTLLPEPVAPTQGQYIGPTDANPGLYTFSAVDAGAIVAISYSFVPADLEEACIQMIAERYGYRGRVGEVSKSLGGQETVRFMRGYGGRPYGTTMGLPPEVSDLIWPYVSVLPPAMGLSQ